MQHQKIISSEICNGGKKFKYILNRYVNSIIYFGFCVGDDIILYNVFETNISNTGRGFLVCEMSFWLFLTVYTLLIKDHTVDLSCQNVRVIDFLALSIKVILFFLSIIAVSLPIFERLSPIWCYHLIVIPLFIFEFLFIPYMENTDF